MDKLIDRYRGLLRQFGMNTPISISREIGKKVIVSENEILLNDERISEAEQESCIAYAVRQVLLPKLKIETDRVLLRPFQMSDSEDCFGFLNDREDCYNDGGFEPFTEMDEEFFLLMKKYSQQPLRKMIVCKETGRVIGTVNIIEVSDRAVEAYEIGYCISKAQQRKGYGYEAVKAVCDCLLNTLHTDILIAGAIEKNTVSLHMLHKLGFSCEGRRTKGFYHPVDGPIDLLYYVLERQENRKTNRERLKIELIEITEINDALAQMVAQFRVDLRSYKGIVSVPNMEDGREEMEEYLAAKYPVFAAVVDGEYAGYVVCRIDNKVVWVESIFSREEYRRRGVAAALHRKAEEIAESYGNDTVYNYVHPNNHRMIAFLRKRGYTVLNLIEIRKPYHEEKLAQVIQVGEHDFDY